MNVNNVRCLHAPYTHHLHIREGDAGRVFWVRKGCDFFDSLKIRWINRLSQFL